MVIIALSLIQIYILFRSQLLQCVYLYVGWLQDGIIKKIIIIIIIIIIITIGKRDQKKSTMIFFFVIWPHQCNYIKVKYFPQLTAHSHCISNAAFQGYCRELKKERNTKPSSLNQQMELWKMGKFDKNLKSWILPSIVFNIFIINEK